MYSQNALGSIDTPGASMTKSKWSLVQLLTQCSASVIACLIFLIFIFSPITAQAARLVTRGSITIVNFLILGEEDSLDFGTVQAPSKGFNHFQLNPSSGNVITTGPGDGTYIGGATPAKYRIAGEPFKDVQVSVHIQDFVDAGIDVLQTAIEGSDSNSIIANLTGTGYITIKVGGLVSVSAQATPGTHTTDITVTAAYQ